VLSGFTETTYGDTLAPVDNSTLCPAYKGTMEAPYIFADMPRDLATALSTDERAFLQEYIIDLNPGEAIRRAGLYRGKLPTPANLAAAGKRQTTKHHVRAALHWLQSFRARHSEITADTVLKRLWAMATADARELSSVRVFCCRRCHGDDHEYQWINHTEFNFAKKLRDDLKDDGGYGYNPEMRPHLSCPHCRGLGERDVFLTDSRDYSSDAQLLYKGAKQTRHGIEILTHDSMAALEKVAKILGMYSDGDPNDNQMRIIVEGGLPE
jgi:phage terminase small subunit